MGMDLLVKGERVKAAILNRPHVNALTASGYAADGTDFAGWLALGKGGAVLAPVSVTTTQSLLNSAFTITLNHDGGNVGFQLGHGLGVFVNFTPKAGTNRGMQSQKITGTLFGTSAASGTGIDAASLACLDISAILDASRTGTSSIVCGVNSVASKWNAIDDSPAGGALIAGLFASQLHAGVTSLVPIQSSVSLDPAATATVAYAVQILKPVLGAAATVSTRAAAIYIDDWSIEGAVGATLTGGYAVYALGGKLQLGAGSLATGGASMKTQLLIGDGPNIAADNFRTVHIEYAADFMAPSVFLKSNTPNGFSYFEHQNDMNTLAGFFLYGSGTVATSPGTAISRANLAELFSSNGSIALNAFSALGAVANIYLVAGVGAKRLTLYGAPAAGTAEIEALGDLDIIDNSKGLVLRSPNNTRYRVQATNAGALTLAAL